MPANSPIHAAPPVIGSAPVKKTGKGSLAGLFLCTGGVLLGAALLYGFNPSRFGFYPRCAMYCTTGLYCPGCGGLRATHQLLHGHFLAALRCNPLFILSLPWLGWLGAKSLRHRLAQGRWLEFHCSGRTVFWMSAVMILFTILRNLPGEPFCYMVPPAGI